MDSIINRRPPLQINHLPTNELTDIHFWYESEFFNHSHSYYEILLLTKGSAVHYFNDVPTTITQRSLAIIPPEATHEMALLNNYTSEHLNISISESLLIELCNSIDKDLFSRLQSSSFSPYVDLSSELFDYILYLADLLNSLPSDSNKAPLFIKQIVFNILCAYSLLPQEPTPHPEWLQEFLQKISTPSFFVQPLHQLYKYAPYAQSKLNKYFKEYVGTTLIAYITKQKINYACNLLQNTNFSVIYISNTLNYASLAHFNRTFKKETGKTPREYRISSQKH